MRFAVIPTCVSTGSKFCALSLSVAKVFRNLFHHFCSYFTQDNIQHFSLGVGPPHVVLVIASCWDRSERAPGRYVAYLFIEKGKKGQDRFAESLITEILHPGDKRSDNDYGNDLAYSGRNVRPQGKQRHVSPISIIA